MRKSREINLIVVRFNLCVVAVTASVATFAPYSTLSIKTMKMNFILRSGFLLICTALLTAHGYSQNVQRTTQGIKYATQGTDVTIEFYSPEIVRVYKTPAGSSCTKESLVIVKSPEKTPVTFDESGKELTLSSESVRVKVNSETGAISFFDKEGKQLLKDKDYGTQFTPFDDAGTPSYNVRQAFLLDKDEVIYGLGQQQTGKVNQRNQKLLLRNQNMSICIPFVHSAKGYALYWDNYSPTTFIDNPQEMSFDSEVGDCADYYFIYGGNADGVIANVRHLTGQAPLYPLWTLGFWQCRERYKSPDELCEVVDKYRELQVPLDGIIQDWQYWGCNTNWNSMKFQNPRYINKMGDPEYMKYLPNDEDKNARLATPRIKSPKEMIDYVHSRNAHIMISVWASFGPQTEMYQKMDSLKALLHFDTWPPNAGVKPYDPFNPVARNLYWEEMKKNIFDLGMDAWWLDSTEPDHLNIKDQDFNTPTALGSFRRVHNAFPLMSNKGVYEHQRAACSDKRVFLLTRSSFLGQQRYASHSWSGDVVSTWESMRKQITAGMNYSLCGIPYWNTDLGGFFAWMYNNDVNNPAYHELHTRWYQWGVFQPIMRSHNSSPVAVEIYQFGKKGDWAYDALEKYTHLRYRLLPYLYSMSWEVTDKAGSMIRPLMMDFPEDRKVLDMDSEYMFGHNFLVRPVTDSLYTWQDKDRNGHLKDMTQTGKADVYLPQGARWIDFWNGQTWEGGQTIQREVPIDIMPVYVRAGSILPWGPAVQYSTEKKWDNLTIRIYPGDDAEFTLYEDEFDNYNYEKGAYSTISMKWNDKERTFTLGNREGNYKGMLKNRKFNLIIVEPGKGCGDKDATVFDKSVAYKGKEVMIQL